MNVRALSTSEIAATQAIALGFRDGLVKRGMTDLVAEARFRVEAHTHDVGFSVVVRDTTTKEVITGANIREIAVFNETLATTLCATGDDLAQRIEAIRTAETLAGGAHMLRGQQVLEEYVKASVSGTPFAKEDIAKLEAEDFAIGNGALRVHASDSAIALLGTSGMNALNEMRGEKLRDAVLRASRRVYARVDVNSNGFLFLEKLNVK